ncbi:uncharacterized protein LOC111611780 [Xiphophorus maculatus]|uniref:uncharacterized protein LOC111611780 n=1 Tax=Xiphophorus maculatus TaxID=8083 RepID=UPI000C6E6FA0|nr:uncharacterized protein LOC111611780 [Xiphophorus maculatus]
MKTLVIFGILLYASLRIQAAVIEVFEETQSVLLPCLYGGVIPEDPFVIWTRNDHNSKVFLFRQEGSDPEGQNQIYRGRTSMSPDALETGNYSLTFRKPELTDSGNYICSIADGVKTIKLTEVQLNVKDVQVEVKASRDAEFVVLPCKTSAGLPKDTRVEWTRSEPEFMFVHAYPNTSTQNAEKDKHYCSRTVMNEDLLRTGDVSLTLRNPTARDSGRYVCTVYRDKDILRQKVVLELVQPVPEPLAPEGIPVWVTVLLVLLVLVVLGLTGGALFYFRSHFIPDRLMTHPMRRQHYEQEHESENFKHLTVDSGAESVLLPCRATAFLPRDVRVEWTNSKNWKVYVYEYGTDQPGVQHDRYRTRARMDENLLRTGNLSLTLKWPTYVDGKIFTCSVSNRDGKILMKKQVQLHVRIQQVVVVDSGAESVLLPCRATKNLLGDAKVEWTDKDSEKVHVYENGSDQLGEQCEFYGTRTKMDENLLETGDLSLTLKHPTIGDQNFYTCRVSNGDGVILMVKQVKLLVKVQHQITVDSDMESVLLPCRTTDHLPGDVRVEWIKSPDRKAHVYENGSDRPGEQSQYYRTRTKMDEEPLRTGDLSLTLRWPTDGDSEIFTCKVSSRNGVVLMKKQVQLNVKDCQVEVEEGAESVLLPFRTTPDLPGDAGLEWRKGNYVTVHVYQNNSDQLEKQNQSYLNRTRMDEDLLKTGDLSLSLRRPTERDSGEYRCLVYSLKGKLQREKTVLLKVKVRRQIHEGTPLIPV